MDKTNPEVITRSLKIIYLATAITVIGLVMTSIGNEENDYTNKLWDEPKFVERVEGQLPDEALQKLEEFLEVRFKTEVWEVFPDGKMIPEMRAVRIPSMRNDVFYSLRFWDHAPAEWNSYWPHRTDIHAWVADIPAASLSMELYKITEYEINNIWFSFRFQNGSRLTITKHHHSKSFGNKLLWHKNRIDGFSIDLDPRPTR